MSSPTANPTARSADAQDFELFTTPATDPAPDRHPSILRPGGHASPLKYPTALRPGAGRPSRTPSPSAHPRLSPQQSPYSPPPPPPVAYKAYSPPRPQSPSDELSAEIEGYFTALEVAPLNIKKQGGGAPETSSAAPAPAPTLPPKEGTVPAAEAGLYRPCASPPVPPKERIEEEHHVVSPMTELEAPAGRIEDAGVMSPVSEPEVHTDEGGPHTEPPPAYDESESVARPPEKAASGRPSGEGGLAGSAVASAAQVGSSVAGVDAHEAIEASSPPPPPAAAAAVPPPLPPRQKPAAQPYKAGGAAATSAANVGAAVAGVGRSEGLQQARKALEKGLGHLIDKAKEHHQHRHQQQNRKSSSGKGKKKEASPPRGGAEDANLSMKAEGDYLYG